MLPSARPEMKSPKSSSCSSLHVRLFFSADFPRRIFSFVRSSLDIVVPGRHEQARFSSSESLLPGRAIALAISLNACFRF